MQNSKYPKDPDSNPDPITGAPGAHPVGTGIGAAGAGAAGAAIGSLAGPIGTAVGAVAGAVAGGLAGKAAAESIDPTTEGNYWRDSYLTRPYADRAVGYDQYEPAYRYGWESYRGRGRSGQAFESIESDLERGWDNAKGTSRLGWDKAKSAARDAWDRVSKAVTPGRDR